MSNSNQTARPIGQLIQLNGKPFAVGLQWWALTSPAYAKREMHEQANSKGLNLGLVYSGLTLQAGMARVPKPEIKSFHGAWSLAAVLASKLGASWFGVFELDDGNFALVAVHDGRIVPGCDLVGDFERVREVVIEMTSISTSAQYSWESIYIADSRLRQYFSQNVKTYKDSISDILGGDKKWDSSLKLKSLAGGIDPKIVMAGLAVLLLSLAFAGYRFYEARRLQQEAELALLNEQALQGDRQAQEIAQARALVNERAIKPDWPRQPKALEVLESCQKSLARIPLNVAGWNIKEISCGTNSLIARYDRQIGTTMSSFEAAALKLRQSGQVDGYNTMAENGNLRILYTNLAPRGEETLEKFTNWSMTWLSHFQALDIATTLTPKPHPEPPPPERSLVNLLGQEEAIPPPPWWDTYVWRFTTQGISGIDIVRPLATAKGFVVQKIIIVPKSDSQIEWGWTLEGEIHVQK